MAIIVRKFQLDGIPLSIYEEENNLTDKPVIFSFHGFTGYKDGDYFKREDYLARMGFIVVGIDTILHGERRIQIYEDKTASDKMKDINHMIIESAEDAVNLYEKYIKFMPRVKKDEVYAMGVSMGGATSIYMSTIYPLKKAVSIVGSPSMVEFYKFKKDKYGWDEDEYYLRNLSYLENFCPVLHPNRVKCPLFLTGGLQDETIPYRFPMMFKDHPLATVKLYDTPHMPNQQQFDDAYEFLLKKD